MKLFESYSKNLLKGAGKEQEVRVLDSKSSDRLESYREWKKSDGVLEIMFSFMSDDGDLILQDENDVKIVLKHDTLKKSMDYYDKKVGEKLVGRTFVTKITDIDEKSGTVYVMSARASSKEMRATIKSRIVGELHAELRKNHVPRVAGTVVKVTNKKAFVDILGKGILGFCYEREWSKGSCRHFKEHCHEGDVLEFDIIRVLPQKEGKFAVFVLSRKDIGADPWESIPDEYLTPGAIITVRCVERPPKKTFWWGVSDLLPNIELQADYTKKSGEIMVGAVYKCFVRKVDRAEHIFRVVPFGIADNEVGTKNAIRFLDPNHKVK